MESMHILVADDNDSVRRLVARALSGDGTRVTQVENGPGALDRARQDRPDLIVLDVNMPKMSGYDVCSALRRDHRTRHIPIILLTARAAPNDVLFGLNIGADDYICKPFDIANFKARASTLLRRSLGRIGVNPLTLLPGNREIRREAEARLRSGRAFGFAYVDMRRFKEFNDRMGFSWGDRIILELAALLRETAQTPGETRGFAGHIGGDDFVLMSARPIDGEELSFKFQERLAGIAKAEGLDADSIAISLSIGQVWCVPGSYGDFDRLAQDVSRRKELSKHDA
ncbi:MAG: hypothetical protein A2X36_13615 [Elusimicrobia bacterium GWA2_69_24]|nr:MAG: hypothetical protein A2X36_13615 [Elusimicrobia bacterium GWA2_69_24]